MNKGEAAAPKAILTACRRVSQAASRYGAMVSAVTLPVTAGAAMAVGCVTRRWNGSAVSAPVGTMSRCFLSLTSGSTGASSVA